MATTTSSGDEGGSGLVRPQRSGEGQRETLSRGERCDAVEEKNMIVASPESIFQQAHDLIVNRKKELPAVIDQKHIDDIMQYAASMTILAMRQAQAYIASSVDINYFFSHLVVVADQREAQPGSTRTRTERNEALSVSCSELYGAYCMLAESKGHKPIGRNTFGAIVHERGFLSIKAKGERAYAGLRLRVASDPPVYPQC